MARFQASAPPVTLGSPSGTASASAPLTAGYHKRRNTELLMLLVACAIGLGGWLLTELNIHGTVPINWLEVTGIWVGMTLACHLLIRFLTPYADPLLLPVVVALNGLGLAMIHRIDLIAAKPHNDALTQFIWTGLGMVLFTLTLVLFRDPRRLARWPFLFSGAGLVLLLLPMLPGLGHEEYGSRIWIRVGPFSFQPSEIAKILLAIGFAGYLVARREVLALKGLKLGPIHLPRARDLGPILIMWAAAMAVLVVQKDLGTSLLFYGLFVMMLYVSTERVGWVVVGTAMFAAGAAAAVATFGHVQTRIDAWLHPFDHADKSFQVIQAQFGFAWGGLTGRGWGLGRPGLTPLAKSDFILGALGEEIGIAGLMAIVVLYGLVVARGLRAALASRDEFTKLLAAGLSFTFALQVFAIVGGVTRLLPLTGLTTPFMSQGGSSLVANWVIVGLLVVISYSARAPLQTLSTTEQVAITRPVREPSPTEAWADDATRVIR